jgi:hypothetical protein
MIRFYDIDGAMYRVAYTSHEHYVEYVIHDVGGYGDDGPIFMENGNNVPVEFAEVFIRGSTKWDGCSNFDFPASEHCMIHACDRNRLASIGALLGRVWDECVALMGEKASAYAREEAQSVAVDVMPWEAR